MWKKIKAWFLKNYGVIKNWFLKNWLLIVNYIVIFVSYSLIYGHDGVTIPETLLGLWLFISMAYAGWNIFKNKK